MTDQERILSGPTNQMKFFLSGNENETSLNIVKSLTELGHEVYTPYFSKDGQEEKQEYSQVLRSDELDSCEVAVFDLGSKGIGISDYIYATMKKMPCISVGKKGEVSIPEHSSVRYFSKVYYFSDIDDLGEMLRVFIEGIQTVSKEREK